MSGADRRTFLTTLGLALAAPAARGDSHGSGPQALPASPQDQNRALVRVLGNTGEGESVWRGSSTIYAYTPDGTVPLLKTQGSERSWWQLEDGNHVRYSSSVTRFLDPASGQPLDEFSNPLTGSRVPLEPGIMRRQDGEVFTPRGSYFRLSRQRFPDMYDDGPLRLDWSAANGILRISRVENFAPVVRRSMYEVRTYFAPLEEALDEDRVSARAGASGWFVSRYSRWLQMDDAPGHMLWHFENLKVESIADLEADYVEWARKVEPRFDQSPRLDEGTNYLDQVVEEEKEQS